MGLGLTNPFSSSRGRRAARRAETAKLAAADEAIGTFQQGDIKRFEQLSPLRDVGTEQFETGRQLTSAGVDFQSRAPGLFDEAQGQFGFGGEQQAFGSQLQSQLPALLQQIQQGSTAGGFASNIEGLRSAFAPLIARRQAESATQLQKLGLGRSSDVINRAADIDLETLIGLESDLFGRTTDLTKLQGDIAGQAFDFGGNAFSTGGDLIGRGTNIFGAGTDAITGGSNIRTQGAESFFTGTPQDSTFDIAGLQAQKGGIRADSILAQNQARSGALGNIVNAATAFATGGLSLPFTGGFGGGGGGNVGAPISLNEEISRTA